MTLATIARAATRPARRVRRVMITTDPDRSRLRFALTTISTLVVVAVVLFTLAAVTGQIVTAAIPGIILGMIASTAVRESRPGPRTLTILLLAPASFASITIAALLSPVMLIADAGFVVVSVLVVFARGFGPRGLALGMLAFMSYFLAIFIRIQPAQLPAVAGALIVAALLTSGIRFLATPRHSDRDLQRLLDSLGYRARRVVGALRDGVQAGGFDERLSRSVRSRASSSASTATAVEHALSAAESSLVDGIENDELAVRVFDFELTVERLTEVVVRVVHEGSATPVQRRELAAGLGRFAAELRRPVQMARQDPWGSDSAALPSGTPADVAAPSGRAAEGRWARLDRILGAAELAWDGVARRGAQGLGESDGAAAARAEASPGDLDLDREPDPSAPVDRLDAFRDLWRVAVQVGVAAALAIAAGTALSSTRWFWAVIAAFVVYVGTSSRGEILTKGWLRVLGTLGGVVFGVLIAAAVGHNTILALVLIVVSLFFGFYLNSISSAFMIFFLTTMLALLYGLLGEFSIALLLTRLEETAVGAAIGVGVAYVVFPTRTRDVAREKTKVFLETLSGALESATSRLTSETVDDSVPAPDDARQLRTTFDDLRTSAKPLTQRFIGASDRSGSRRTLQILGACEHHGRVLLRLADRSSGIADTPLLRRLLEEASATVRGNIDALRAGLDGRVSDVTVHPAASLLDEFEDNADARASPHRLQLIAASRNLRAIDLAIDNRASELGARSQVAPASAPESA
ncbi:MAG: hypothetical protein JWP75_57 [Frondihabitans sp.]|nr:hypothetical protein [Frondihabitans sp.]